MLRKRVLKARSIKPKIDTSELNITASACIVVTSESRDHPVQNAFDGHRGPGGSEWIAEGPGEQAIVLVFDSPQTIRRILFEVEEEELARSQEVRLLISRNNGSTFDDLLRQGFNFSPPGTVFEREQWEVDIQEVTDFQVRIVPDTQGRSCRARLTALALW